MRPTLRPYQHLADLDLQRAWRTHRRALLVLPTGAGKTVTGMHVVDRALTRGSRVLWLAHLDVLLEQATRTAARYGHTASVLRASDPRYRASAPLQVASMQTVTRRLAGLLASGGGPDLVVIDEAHRSACASYQTILDAYPTARVLGLTATPWRLDEQGLSIAFDAIVSCPVSIEQLVTAGSLCPIRMKRAEFEASTAGMRKVGGDYTAKAAEERMMPGLGDVARGIVEAVRDGHGPVVAFCASIAHSVALRDAVAVRGLRAQHVDGETGPDEREALLGERGAVALGLCDVVCSVGVLDEGVDCPRVGTVVLASPTASSGRYLQRIGRGMRPAAGKEYLLVLDYGGNWRRHGWPLEDLRPWYSLTGSPAANRKDKDEPPPLKQCGQCFGIAPAWRGPCPMCGYEEPVKPVVVADKDSTLADVAVTETVSWSDRRKRWDWFADRAVEKGYKPAWAAMGFKAAMGFWPPKAWMEALKARLAGEGVSP